MVQHINTKNIIAKDQLLFTDKNSRILTTSQFNLYLKRLCDRFCIKNSQEVNQHMLRHTFATRCIESGMPATVLQKILGHTNIKITLDTYCDVFAEYERKHVDMTQEYLKEKKLLL